MPTDSPVTDGHTMRAFRSLMTIVLIAGAAAGLILSAIQHVTIGPLIARAERYEHASEQHGEGHGESHDVSHDVSHGAEASSRAPVEAWQPTDGLERTSYTVLGTVLTGIAFAAILFGLASTFGLELNFTRGLLLGLFGFACFALAPAIGLPPKPPGAAAAELHAAQVWWVSSTLATAVGLWAIARSDGSWIWRAAGMVIIALPHLIGAPAPVGSSPTSIPADLSRAFAIASVGTQAVFWIALGAIGGPLYARAFRASSMGSAR